MITIAQVESYLQKLHDTLQAVNWHKLVIDDSQLTSFLRNISNDENTMLIGVIPSHKLKGTDIDSILSRDYLQFLVLNKTDDNAGYDDFMENMRNTQATAKHLLQQIINDATDPNSDCDLAKYLDANTISIDPVWKLSGCDGYSIEIQLKTNPWD